MGCSISPLFSPVVVAKRPRRRQDKARAGRATEAYLTVRRGARPGATESWRMYLALEQTTGEKCGLAPRPVDREQNVRQTTVIPFLNREVASP